MDFKLASKENCILAHIMFTSAANVVETSKQPEMMARAEAMRTTAQSLGATDGDLQYDYFIAEDARMNMREIIRGILDDLPVLAAFGQDNVNFSPAPVAYVLSIREYPAEEVFTDDALRNEREICLICQDVILKHERILVMPCKCPNIHNQCLRDHLAGRDRCPQCQQDISIFMDEHNNASYGPNWSFRR